MEVKELFEKAKLKLFTQEFLFWGLNIVKFRWYAHKMDKHIEGYVMLRKKDDQAIDRTIHINEECVSDDSYTVSNLTWLLIHEFLHILHKHQSRMKDREKAIWAIATDHVIERTIKGFKDRNSKQLLVPYKDHYNIIEDLNRTLPQCGEEEAYDWLFKNKKFYKITVKPGENGDPDTAEIRDQHGNLIGESIIHEDPNGDRSAIENESDNIIAEARASLQTMKDRGLMSGGILEYLDDLLKVDIPWETLLRKAIKTNIIYKPNDRAWYRPNKFLRPIGLYTPGEVMTEEKDGMGTLAVHVDSSGSMSEKDLRKGLYIIMESIQYFAKIIVIIADVEIQQVREFEKNDFTAFYAFVKEGIQGRGGTSHKYVFDYCQEKIYKEDPDLFSMFISFTDGCSDIEHQIGRYEWCKRIPSVYILSDKRYELNLKEYEKVEVIKVN